MFLLQLNPMTDRAQAIVAVLVASTREAIETYMKDCEVEPYTDEGYHKVYRMGSLLEWFNPPHPNGKVGIGHPSIIALGTEDEFAARAAAEARASYRSLLGRVANVDGFVKQLTEGKREKAAELEDK